MLKDKSAIYSFSGLGINILATVYTVLFNPQMSTKLMDIYQASATIMLGKYLYDQQAFNESSDRSDISSRDERNDRSTYKK
jgi:hypothetical protein